MHKENANKKHGEQHRIDSTKTIIVNKLHQTAELSKLLRADDKKSPEKKRETRTNVDISASNIC